MTKRTGARARSRARQIAEGCIASRTRQLGRLVTTLYDSALRPHGLTVAQLTLLAAIAHTAPARASELTTLLDIEKSTLSRNIGLLSERGWVRVEAEGRDKLVSVSADGEQLLVEAFESWKKAQAAARERLGEGVVDTLDRLLHPPAQ